MPAIHTTSSSYYQPTHMIRLFAQVPLHFLFISASFSQIHWQKVDSAYLPLPSSLHVFKTTDSLNGRPFIAYVLSAKLKDKKLSFTVQTGKGSRYTPSQYYQQEQLPLV